MNKTRCQSCGIPLDDQWFLGTESNGEVSSDFCRLCYLGGKFVEPELTLKEAKERNYDFMTRKLKIDETKAREFTDALFLQLSRWKQNESIS